MQRILKGNDVSRSCSFEMAIVNNSHWEMFQNQYQISADISFRRVYNKSEEEKKEKEDKEIMRYLSIQ